MSGPAWQRGRLGHPRGAAGSGPPRIWTTDGSEKVPVPAYELFSSTDLLGAMAMERMLAKLLARRDKVGLEPVGAEVSGRAGCTSKSAVSRRFV